MEKKQHRTLRPLITMLEKEIPVGAGTDELCVASYNPWNSLYWLLPAKRVGGNPS